MNWTIILVLKWIYNKKKKINISIVTVSNLLKRKLWRHNIRSLFRRLFFVLVAVSTEGPVYLSVHKY